MLASDSRRYVCRLLLPERFLARTPFFSAPPEQADRPTIISRASRVVSFGDPVDSNFQGASSRGSRDKSGALSGHPTIPGTRLTEGIEIAYPAESVGFPLDVRACRQYPDDLATVSRRTRKPASFEEKFRFHRKGGVERYDSCVITEATDRYFGRRGAAWQFVVATLWSEETGSGWR